MIQYMRKIILGIIMLLLANAALAQSARDLIRMGNKAYREGQYGHAETMYLKSIDKSPSFEAYYNLGNAYIMQQKDSTAFENYKRADSLGTADPKRRAANFHNMGNIWYAQGVGAMRMNKGNPAAAFQRAVEFYKSSLRCNPDDNETRYNLAMALYQLKKNQNNGGGGDGKNDEDKDDKQVQQKQEQQDQQKQEQQQQDKQQPQQQNQQKQEKKDDMSDQAAEQLLNSAQQDEKNVQRKLKENTNNRRRSLEKDW